MPKRKMPEAHQLKSGSWHTQVFVGFDENGKKIRESFTASTKREAEKMAAEYIVNGMQRKARFTVADAIDGYISAKQNVLAPSTLRGYGILRRNRLQSLMRLGVSEINSYTVQQAINEDAAKVG